MEAAKPSFIDYPLLGWCLVVGVEFFIIAILTHPIVMLLCLVVFPPFLYAVNPPLRKKATPVPSLAAPAIPVPAGEVLPAPPPVKTGPTFFLVIRGLEKPLELTMDRLLNQDDLVGKVTGFDKPIARVSRKPGDESVVGLTNLTDQAWVVEIGGGKRKVEPGRSIGLEDQLIIQLGEFNGIIELRGKESGR